MLGNPPELKSLTQTGVPLMPSPLPWSPAGIVHGVIAALRRVVGAWVWGPVAERGRGWGAGPLAPPWSSLPQPQMGWGQPESREIPPRLTYALDISFTAFPVSAAFPVSFGACFAAAGFLGAVE